jgi:hypothetical protein
VVEQDYLYKYLYSNILISFSFVARINLLNQVVAAYFIKVKQLDPFMEMHFLFSQQLIMAAMEVKQH